VRSPRSLLEAGWSARDQLRARRVVVPRLDQGGEAEFHVGNPLLDFIVGLVA